MKKIRVVLVSASGQEIIFEKVKRGRRYVFEAKIPPNSGIRFCPYCGKKVSVYSPVSCKSHNIIGTVTKDGYLRVQGNPFKNWKFSPFDGEELVERTNIRKCCPGP